MDTNLLYAIGVIAVLALVGRILINRYKGGSINWMKMGFIGLMVVAFALVYFTFDPYEAKMWWDGEATLSEGTMNDLSGRKAGADIPHFASDMDANRGRYYALDATTLTPTGFYCLKSLKELANSVERTEELSQNDTKIIKRKTSLLEITRNPGERIDKYLSVYKVALEGKGEVLACMREEDANANELPVALMVPMVERMLSVAERIEGEKSELITDYYFILYNCDFYNRNVGLNMLIYKGIAGIVAALVIAIIYNVAMIRKRKTS